MSAAPSTGGSDGDWITLLGGVRVSRQWMTRQVPKLLGAWCEAATEDQRHAIAAEILRVAAEMESEPIGREYQPADPRWEAVADRIDPRLLDGPDWWALAAALTRAAAGGYDVPAGLAALAAAPPLPDRHVARELHWRLLDDCPAAVPVEAADGRPSHVDGRITGLAQPHRNPQVHRHIPLSGRGDPASAQPFSEGDPP